MALGGLSLTAPPASAAPTSPVVDVDHTVAGTSGDVVLAWLPVAGATSYKVEVDTSDLFTAPLSWSSTTFGLRATPTVPLPAGTTYWRVAAIDGSGQGEWTVSTFERSTAAGPALLSPGASGAETLDHPTEPPVLTWEPVPGAKSYTVAWSTNDLFPEGGTTTTATTTTTAYAVPTLLARGVTWYWRVQANLDNSLTTEWSANGEFVVSWPSSAPTLLAPDDDPGGARPVSDVAMRWATVPGAKSYKVYVATDPDFASQISGSPFAVMTTSYAPARTLDNAAYYWKVAAVDTAGNDGPPSATRQFSRAWGPTTAAGMSVGQRVAAPAVVAPASGSSVTSDDFRLEWTAVPRAAVYEVWVTKETSNFFTDSGKIVKCYTPHTSLTAFDASGALSAGNWMKFPRLPQALDVGAGGTFRWRVRASTSARGGRRLPPAAGQRRRADALRALGLVRPRHRADPASVTVTTTHPTAIAGLAPTPVSPHWRRPAHLRDPCPTPPSWWTPAQDAAAGYWVEIALDRDFTNKVGEFHTDSARLRLDGGLLDNSANQAYYWRAMGCTTFGSTFASKSCLSSGLAQVRAFRKLGVAVTGLDAQTTGDEVSLSWQEHSLTAPDGGGVRGYQVQVATDNLFSTVVLDTKVDQPFVTTWSSLLQDGGYYWRVRALDGVAATLPWSAASTFTKSAPKPTQTQAASGPAAPPLVWQALSGTKTYDLEIYSGANLSVGGTKVVTATGLVSTAYTVSTVLAPGTYSWRVRRHDDAEQHAAVDRRAGRDDPHLRRDPGRGLAHLARQRGRAHAAGAAARVGRRRGRGALPGADLDAVVVQLDPRERRHRADPLRPAVGQLRPRHDVLLAGAPAQRVGLRAQRHERVPQLHRAHRSGRAGAEREHDRHDAADLVDAWLLRRRHGAGLPRALPHLRHHRLGRRADDRAVGDVGACHGAARGHEVRGAGRGRERRGDQPVELHRERDHRGPARSAGLAGADLHGGRLPRQLGQACRERLADRVVHREVDADRRRGDRVDSRHRAHLHDHRSADPGRLHTVEVAATNTVGMGAFATGAVTTGVSPPAAVAAAVTRGNRTAGVSWSEPATGGLTFSRYDVISRRYDPSTNAWSAWATTGAPATARSLPLTSLLPGFGYEVKVAAVNTAGVGPAGAVVAFVAMGTPGAGRPVARSKAGVVTLTWKAAAANGSTLKGYRVWRSGNGRTWTVLRASTPAASLRFTAKRGVTLWVKVAAINSLGVGAISPAAKFKVA
jgi:hypothetical protein